MVSGSIHLRGEFTSNKYTSRQTGYSRIGNIKTEYNDLVRAAKLNGFYKHLNANQRAGKTGDSWDCKVISIQIMYVGKGRNGNKTLIKGEQKTLTKEEKKPSTVPYTKKQTKKQQIYIKEKQNIKRGNKMNKKDLNKLDKKQLIALLTQQQNQENQRFSGREVASHRR